MNLIRLPLVLCVVLYVPLTLARPNFNYVGAGYARDHISYKGAGCNQGGLYLDFSLALNEVYYLQARHVDETSSSWCGDTSTSVGLGIQSAFGSESVMFAAASAIRRDYPDDDNIGVGLQAGVRSVLIHGTEIKGFLGYESIDGWDKTMIGVGANMWMNQSYSANLDLTFGNDNETGLMLGVRYNF